MTASPRLLLGAGVLLVAGWALVAVFGAGREPEGRARAFTSSRQCAECHPEVWREWSDSWHAKAWTDPEVRFLSNEFQNTDCIDCHAPRPVFETGIGNRVLPRSTRRSEGVDCITCHLLPEGSPEADGGGLLAGTLDDPRAACRPVAVRALGSPEHCGTCHDQHKTVQQWRASPWAERGIGCVECHMPAREGGPRPGRDHTMAGGHDIELVRSAVTLRGRRQGEAWIVEVENVGAGHHFPTDERSRAADVFWRPVAAEGTERTEPWRHAYRFRSPYRHEVDLEDTLLSASETRTIEIEGDETDGPIEVALFYKLTPYWKDADRPDPEKEARMVHHIVLEP